MRNIVTGAQTSVAARLVSASVLMIFGWAASVYYEAMLAAVLAVVGGSPQGTVGGGLGSALVARAVVPSLRAAIIGCSVTGPMLSVSVQYRDG